MNSLIRQFFSVGKLEERPFREVLFLSDGPSVSWEEISKKAPELPRGWFELSRLSPHDRVEFTRDYWLDRLPFNPQAHSALKEFFEELDDVGVVLTREEDEEILRPELVYSLEDNSSFFRGKPPGTEEEMQQLLLEIGGPLPQDYLAFMEIHNGFGKLSEMGIIQMENLGDVRRRVIELLVHASEPVKSGEYSVDPGALLPFYEALGLSSFQCFYADWYPGSEMGNVYLSGIDYTISDTSDKRSWAENLAFPTFLEWFAYYLQGMNLSP